MNGWKRISVASLASLMLGGFVPGFAGRAEGHPDAPRRVPRPFQRELAIPLAFRQNAASFRVPAGAQLVIEYVSASGDVPFGQNLLVAVQTTVGGETATHFLVPSRLDWQRIPGIDYDVIRLRQWLRIYADGGTEVVVKVARTGGWGTGAASVTLSGYLSER